MADLPVLAQFVRARREALSPEDVGLRPSGRRRTPGLRREEVATLAGVSIDYLVRLEQGRDTNPSPSVLNGLADALRLSPAERMHLAGLAAQSHSPDFCPGGSVAEPEVGAGLQALLERFDPSAAVVIGPYGDVLAWTPAWAEVVGPMGFLEDERPNIPRFTFCSPRAREVFVDWEAAADKSAGLLRAVALRWRDDERFVALIDELNEVAEFAARWAAHPVARKERMTQAMRHPQLGLLQIDIEVLLAADDSGQRFAVWLPADAATAAAFDRAAGAATPVSPAQLRIVGEA